MGKARTFKYWILQLHLWLGLASGLVVLIVSITGCLFVFQQEISEALHKDCFFVRPSTAGSLPLDLLKEKAQKALGPDQLVANIVVYRQPDRSWEFMAYKGNDSALTYFGELTYYRSVWLDPYTGAVTGIRDNKYDFFSIVKSIHWSLLLSTTLGQPIVGWSTLIFVILLITGIVLWWPKKWTKAWRDRSFKIKWKASFKRVNYDLHNVPGFYSLFPALLIALTGMVMSFRWFSALVYVAAAGTTTHPVQITARSVIPATMADPLADPLDKALLTTLCELPDAARFGISPAAGKEGVIYATAYKGRDTYYGYDVLQFDQYSGKLLHHLRNKQKNAGQRLEDMNYDIHVGAIAGLTGKIIAFIASLICASLPVTGFLIWWGKRHKRPRQTPPPDTPGQSPHPADRQ